VAPGPSGDPRLVGYFSSSGGEYAPRREELRRFLAESLPEYMIPAAFVEVDELPLTSNGKVDRRALPPPPEEDPETAGSGRRPSTETERRVAAIWEEALGRAGIGADDDFFRLGGHSVIAARIFAKIESALGVRLPLAVLLQAPTIAGLAAVVDGRGWESSWSSLVPLQPKGTKPPLFCIHPIGGNVVGYVDLARRLGEDQPLYGLQAVGLDGKRPRHKRIEDMADHYVSEIRRLQPSGPYYLAGSSFGGTVAFEMAHRLLAQGCEVAFLGMFDTWGPDYRRKPEMGKWRITLERTRERIILHGGNLLAAKGLGAKARYVRAKAGRVAHNVAKRMRRARKPAAPPPPAAIPKNLANAEKAVLRAKTVYAPRPYPGKITLFRASRQPAWFHPDPFLGWVRFAAGEIETHEVPGYHGALAHEPRVAVLAEKVEECLARARESGKPPAKAAAGRVR
jgi:thioesterase domain-containing protein/acyl carrier protein